MLGGKHRLVIGVCVALSVVGFICSAIYEHNSKILKMWPTKQSNFTALNFVVSVREVKNTTDIRVADSTDAAPPPFLTTVSVPHLSKKDGIRTTSKLDTALSSNVSHQLPTTQSDSCTAKNQVVFLKTHKTGSTTLASIFERYGYYNNLTFALPISRHYFAPVQDLFARRNMAQINPKYVTAFKKNSWKGYNFLTNHARYNRPEMDAVVHNATYVTILRYPAEQFESTFGYYEFAGKVGLQNVQNPIAKFMEKPQHYIARKFIAWYWARNAQLYDLGFNHASDEDTYTIQHKIKQLDFEFDLVMLTEYFDESLLVLRKLMCWEWDDILYLPKGIRSSSHRIKMTDSLRDKIIAWNNADVELYNHFNQTLWRRIREYGPTFENDLTLFRSKLRTLQNNCIAVNRTDTKDKREEKTILRSGASELCHRIYRDDVRYTDMIRRKMTSEGFLMEQLSQGTRTVAKIPPGSAVKRKRFPR